MARSPSRIVRAGSATPETRAARNAALISAHAEGLRSAEIAGRFGLSISYVYVLFDRLRRLTGLKLAFDTKGSRAKHYEDHVRRRQAEVEAAFKSGLSARHIVRRLGLSVSCVRSYVARLRRTTGEPFRFDDRENYARRRQGRERRRLLAEAYLPGITSEALAERLGLLDRLVREDLVKLRRETRQPFAIARRTPEPTGSLHPASSKASQGLAAVAGPRDSP